MVARIVLAVFLFILMIRCVSWTVKYIIEKDDMFAMLCLIGAVLFGLLLGVLLGSLLI